MTSLTRDRDYATFVEDERSLLQRCAFLLVGQLLDQAVTLVHQGGELRVLGMKSSLGLPQLCPQTGVGRCRDGRKRRNNKRKSSKKIRPDCSAVGPNLGDYSPQVRQRAPAKKKKDSLQLSDKSAVCLPSSSTLRLKAVTRRLW